MLYNEIYKIIHQINIQSFKNIKSCVTYLSKNYDHYKFMKKIFKKIIKINNKN